KQYNTTEKNVMIDDAVISYQLNGQTRTVTALGNGRYRVVGQQKAGDWWIKRAAIMLNFLLKTGQNRLCCVRA
ncbi:MAG: hypothetical protein ACFNQD_05215, partial [Prevotella intermedia]